MTLRRDPPRLLDPKSSTDPQLRELLGVASTHAPSPAQLDALARKVHAATAVHAAAGSGATIARWHVTLTGVSKLSLALLAAGAAGWLSWNTGPTSRAVRERRAELVVPDERADVNSLQPSAAEANTAPQPRAAGVASPLAQPGSALLPTLAQAPTRPRPSQSTEPRSVASRQKLTAAAARTRHRAGSASHTSAPQLPTAEAEPTAAAPAPAQAPLTTAAITRGAASELDLLSRAQGLLARDPLGALGVIEQHASAYPHGEFAEEREALAIDALRRLGRRSELQERARAFMRVFPASPHRERIAAWLR